MSIELGIGVSSQADVWTAGVEAAEQAVAHLANRRPDFTLVFSSVRFADPRLLKGVRSVTSQAPLVGCTDAGGIITSGPRRRSVTVIGIVLNDAAFSTAVGRHLSINPFHAGQELVNSLRKTPIRDPRGLFIFMDGLATSGSEVVSGIDRAWGAAIPIVGGSAADDFRFQKTFQFFNEEVLTDGAVGVMLEGAVRIGVGVRHGWVPVGRPRRVTRASGHVVYQLDRRPAISIYEDYLGIKREELIQEPLAYATITYPLGSEIVEGGEYLLRDAIRVGRAGSLICTGDVPMGSQVQLMIGGYESALEAAQQAACDAVDDIGRSQLKGALIFNSVARQRMLGSEFQGEIDVIRDALGGAGVRLGGFYTYGEIAPFRPEYRKVAKARNMFHNESVVVVALG